LSDEAGSKSFERFVALLETVVTSQAPVSSSMICSACGIPESTVHRYIGQLVRLGVLQSNGDSPATYSEGTRLVEIAVNTLNIAAHRNMRRAILAEVAEKTGETCHFCVEREGKLLVLDSVTSQHLLCIRVLPGSMHPLHATAGGKLILAALSDSVRETILGEARLQPSSANTITDRARLIADLQRCLRSQVAMDDQEHLDDVVSIAVPVAFENGALIGALGISAPASRCRLAKLKDFLPILRQAARRMARTYAAAPQG